jgi:type I restriction enzyme S subunit
MLPEGWTCTTVGDACAIKNNLRMPLNVEQRGELKGPYPYFGPTGVLDYIDHYRIDEEFAVIGEDGDHFLKYREKSMTLHFAGKANVNNHAHIIGTSEKCTPKWFYYWFMHRDLTSSLSRQGVGRYKLTKKALCQLEIWIPPMQEQLRISQILSLWDESIRIAEETVANLKLQRLNIADQLISGKKRLRSGTPWKQTSISELVRESRIAGSGGHEARKLTVKLYGKGVISKVDRRPGSEATRYYRRRSGQFIYSKLDFLNGAFGLVPDSLDGYESTLDLPAFDFLPGVDPKWFLSFVSREEFYRGQLGLANGGRKARRVNPDDLLRVQIDVPGLDEQHAIAEAIETCSTQVLAAGRQVELLKREKAALLDDLLTGKRRVRIPSAKAAS